MGVVKAITWMAGGQYLCFAMQFVCSIAIARWFLNPTEMGIFSVTISAYFIISACQDFGLSRYIVQRKDINREQIRTVYTLFFFASATLCAIVLIFASSLGQAFENAQVTSIARVLALNFLTAPLGLPAYAMLQRDMQFKELFFVNGGSTIASSLVALGCASQDFGAISLAYSAVAGQLTKNAVAFAYRRDQIIFRFSLRGSREILQFGSVVSWMNVFGTLCMRSPEIIIGRLANMAAVGIYGRGAGLADQLRWLLGAAVTAAVLPAFARIKNEGGNLSPAYIKLTTCFTGVLWPAFALLALLSGEIVDLLLGPKWSAASTVVYWLALSQLFFSAVPSHIDMFTVSGRLRLVFCVNLIEGIAGVLLFVVFARAGADSAAFSRVIYGALFVLLNFPFLCRALQLQKSYLLAAYGRSLIVALFAVLPTAFALSLHESGLLPFSTWSVSSCLGLGCWLIGLRLTKHPLWAEIAHVVAIIITKRTGLASADSAT